jgi:tetratricopeptide (TPR) repeat protein
VVLVYQWVLVAALVALTYLLLTRFEGPTVGWGAWADQQAIFSLRHQGKWTEAAARIELLLGRPGVLRTGQRVNQLVEALVASGQYREALQVPPPDPRWAEPGQEMLIQINLAEADYNLGRWDEAWQRLAPLDAEAALPSICESGLLLQRAWIAAHQGRGAEALELWTSADIGGLPYEYWAEHHFTGAAALLALGRLDEALEAAQGGAADAVRPSSLRNVLFLQARIHAAAGRLAEAEALCREAAAHPLQTQGGDGLLLWGDLLLELGRPEEALAAWRLCVERDPQSESAQQAQGRLEERRS